MNLNELREAMASDVTKENASLKEENARLRQMVRDIERNYTDDMNSLFGSAYDISYTDVYDFCSKKQSLKKWEIELGIHHQEMSLPWDQPVPEELWEEVAKYCDNDVLATEAVFEKNKGDFAARQIQVELVHKKKSARH